MKVSKNETLNETETHLSFMSSTSAQRSRNQTLWDELGQTKGKHTADRNC